MALPEDVTPEPLQVPLPRTAPLQAELPSPGGLSWNYIGGAVFGSVLAYSDLSDFAWWVPLRLPDRFGSHYRESLSDIIRGVRQADVSAAERLTPTSRMDLGSYTDYATILRPIQPIARLTASREQQAPAYEQSLVYETARERLGRTYPASILATTQAALGKDEAPAHEIVTYVFEQWREIYDWFDFEPVPPLVWFIRDENGEYNQTPVSSIIQLRQNEEGTISMATFIDRLLRTFQGYAFRCNVAGKFQILPAPWATSALTSETDVAIDPAYILAGDTGAVTMPLPAGHVDGSSGMPIVVSEQPIAVTVSVETFVNTDTSSAPGPLGAAISLPVTRELRPGPPIFDGREVVGGPQRFMFTMSHEVGGRHLHSYDAELVLSYDDVSGEISVDAIVAQDEWAAQNSGGVPTDLRPLGWRFIITARTIPPWGIRSQVLTEDEVKDHLGTGTLDLSRIINVQRATSSPMGYVDEQSILTGVFTKHDAGFTTDYQPGGKIAVERGAVQRFEDGGEPIIVGSEPISVAYRWTIRRSANGHPFEGTGDDAGFENTGEIELLPGERKSISIPAAGLDMMSGTIGQLVLTRRGSEGNSSLVVEVHGIPQSNNVFAARPFFAHLVEIDVQGTVWAETGEELSASYGFGSVIDPDDMLTTVSGTTFGVREGSSLPVEFFEASYEDLLNICRSTVYFSRQARRRWDSVALTAASPKTPEDLNKITVMPNGIAAVMYGYEYSDARSYDAVRASRSIALEELYSLASDLGGPAVDTLTNPTENAVAMHEASYLL